MLQTLFFSFSFLYKVKSPVFYISVFKITTRYSSCLQTI